MTRRRDLMCEDIFGCTHEPEIPISDDATGEIVSWRCRCGRDVPPVEKTDWLPQTTEVNLITGDVIKHYDYVSAYPKKEEK